MNTGTSDIYGVLVAWSAILQEGYIIPAKDVIDDVRCVTGAESIELPTLNDALWVASQFGNIKLVNSLIVKGAQLPASESNYAGSGSSPQSSLPSSRPSSTYSFGSLSKKLATGCADTAIRAL